MRLLKPLLAGAALLTLAAPALASAQSFYHDGGRDYQRDGGYEYRGFDRRDGGDYGYRQPAFVQRDYGYRDGGYRPYGDDYGYRDFGYGYGHRHHHWRHWWSHERGW